MHPIGPELPISAHLACARVCRQLYVLCASHALVQATVGVGTVITVYIGVAYTRGGGYFFLHFEASRIHPTSQPTKTDTFLRVARPLHVEKISSSHLANQAPFWHYLGVSRGTPQHNPGFQTYFFLDFSARRTHPNSLPVKMDTFLCVAPPARVEKISSILAPIGHIAGNTHQIPIRLTTAGQVTKSVQAGTETHPNGLSLWAYTPTVLSAFCKLLLRDHVQTGG